MRRCVEAASHARIFALTSQAPLFVMPLTQIVRDQLHAANGTGEWPEIFVGATLTTTDLAWSARASVGSALAWVARTADVTEASNHQSAAVWIDGGVAMKPTQMSENDRRPRKLWPVNMALRLLGVETEIASGPFQDESVTFGLAR